MQIFTIFQMIFDGNNAVLLIATTYEEDSGKLFLSFYLKESQFKLVVDVVSFAERASKMKKKTKS